MKGSKLKSLLVVGLLIVVVILIGRFWFSPLSEIYIGHRSHNAQTEPLSALEKTILDRVSAFKQSEDEFAKIDLSSLLPKSLRTYCVQSIEESRGDFERKTARRVDGYRPITSGKAWWFFYEDKSYDAVYLSDVVELVNKNLNPPRAKCSSPKFLELTKQVVFEERVPVIGFIFTEE